MTYRIDAATTIAQTLHRRRGLLHRIFWPGHDCPACYLDVWPVMESALPLRPPGRGAAAGTVTVNVTADTTGLQEQLRRAADALRLADLF
jgi:hypothetical protein